MTRTRRGLTLSELVMAMAITTVIGLAAGGVAIALSSADAHLDARSAALSGARTSMRLIRRSFQECQLITAAGPGGKAVAYWVGDENGDGEMNIAEMRLLRYDVANRQILEYRIEYPASFTDARVAALNDQVDLEDVMTVPDVRSVLFGDAYCTSKAYAVDVAHFRCTAMPATPLSTMVAVELTVGGGDEAVTIRSAVAPRALMVQYVDYDVDDDDDWRLVLPGD